MSVDMMTDTLNHQCSSETRAISSFASYTHQLELLGICAQC